MNFRTALEGPSSTIKLEIHDRILSLGSCFASNVGQLLKDRQWQITVNPHGIIYNPISISKHIAHACDRQLINTEALVQQDARWHHLDFHSEMSHADPSIVVENIEEGMALLKNALLRSDYIFLTLGTAWVFTYNTTNEIVANCHKIPANHFHKKLLTPAEISQSLIHIIDDVKSVNPKAKFVISVSPVRHIRNGMIDNNRSKARLLEAVHSCIDRFHEEVFYFPGYELLLDDLRDYRFYADDLIHPNNQAMQYIFQYFQEHFLSDKAKVYLGKIEKIRQRLLHRPVSPDSEAHKAFIEKTNDLIAELKDEVPHLNL